MVLESLQLKYGYQTIGKSNSKCWVFHILKYFHQHGASVWHYTLSRIRTAGCLFFYYKLLVYFRNTPGYWLVRDLMHDLPEQVCIFKNSAISTAKQPYELSKVGLKIFVYYAKKSTRKLNKDCRDHLSLTTKSSTIYLRYWISKNWSISCPKMLQSFVDKRVAIS